MLIEHDEKIKALGGVLATDAFKPTDTAKSLAKQIEEMMSVVDEQCMILSCSACEMRILSEHNGDAYSQISISQCRTHDW